MKQWTGFEHGMGIGGWLTNYKRFNCLPPERRLVLTVGDYEHFETYITEEDVRNIYDLGMDHIRLGFDQLVIEEKPGVLRRQTVELLLRFADWCEKYGIGLVLNMHKAIGNYCDIEEKVGLLDDEGLQQRFIAVWEQLEEIFHDRPAVVFELLNEVRDVDPELWNDLAGKTITAIRKKSLTRQIVVGGVCGNAAWALGQLRVFDDENVIYTFHCYDPYGFTHQQGVLQPPPMFYNRKMPWPGDIERYRDFERVAMGKEDPLPEYAVMDRRYIEDTMKPAFKFMEKNPDKILWCGEFGTIRHCPIEWRENWTADVISILKEHSIPYCVWNYLSTPNDGNRFSLVDDDTRKILSPRMAKIIRGEV